MVERACPGCGWVHELIDTMDACPPIPTHAWPERWSIHDGEGGSLMFCPRCETEIDEFPDLPDYPWKVKT